ncbi:hypothetical protein Nepgr_021067 [Nepenthes gracilis]|uniref:Zinc finger PHD-type domain-containing protein n=1 Tax=Nepenthes gracilis TaxID=150966 RepID=A0AAD3SYF0_NEPGR|nr:hypothetical protein Nepgr_021067 [Nepenthes gracilis]
MLIPLLETCKKRKRKPKLYAFHTFCDPRCPINPSGPFRDNIRFFIQECADVEDYHVNEMPVWCTLLVQENRGIVVPLYTVEETVTHSKQPFCDHCRCAGLIVGAADSGYVLMTFIYIPKEIITRDSVELNCDDDGLFGFKLKNVVAGYIGCVWKFCLHMGWSHHFVSKRKYHLIIPVDADWNKPLTDSAFGLQTHLLHGLIHCNGFGHLLCINGRGGGSNFLCGREIMDLWDRICTNLHAQKITVEDVSKKKSMDLRLLHGVAYGHPWFGRWGYRFYHGSFGVTEHKYHRALEVLSSLQLDDIIQDFSKTDQSREMTRIIRCYRDLSETCLITIRDLLRLMLTLKSQVPINPKLALAKGLSPASFPLRSSIRAAPPNKLPIREKPIKCHKFAAVIASMDSRWPTRRLHYAAEVIVNALKESESSNQSGMTRQEVRDAARLHIGDTGLLDYVLKSMNNVIVGNHLVQRAINPVHRVLEYTIQELTSSGASLAASRPETESVIQAPASIPTVESCFDVYNDVFFLYKNVLQSYPESDVCGLATQDILDSKCFIKEFPFRDDDDQLLRFICRVLPSSMELDMELSKDFSPGELIVIPLYATIGELKIAAEKALRDTYCITEEYVVTELESVNGLNDEEVVFGALKSGSEVWVKGIGIDLRTELRYEGGPDNWTVKCECGARDDDGERMVSCDICEVWQHTRCSGIEDSDTVPPLFVCRKCCSSLVPQSAEMHGFQYETSETVMLSSGIGFWEEDATRYGKAGFFDC